MKKKSNSLDNESIGIGLIIGIIIGIFIGAS